LESQYWDFKGQTQPDGTPKIWVYFEAFEEEPWRLAASLEEASTFTQKAREWLDARPGSIPALLALGLSQMKCKGL
jgi:hypothetical protein